jgi:hypothetical protein
MARKQKKAPEDRLTRGVKTPHTGDKLQFLLEVVNQYRALKKTTKKRLLIMQCLNDTSSRWKELFGLGLPFDAQEDSYTCPSAEADSMTEVQRAACQQEYRAVSMPEDADWPRFVTWHTPCHIRAATPDPGPTPDLRTDIQHTSDILRTLPELPRSSSEP